MDPSKKGWLSLLLAKSQIDESQKLSVPRVMQLYKYLQPTGLIYGYSVNVPEVDAQDEFSDLEKAKIIYTQGLRKVYDLFDQNKLGFAESVIKFFEGVYPESISEKTKASNDIHYHLEHCIEDRLEISSTSYKTAWATFFQNSFLYIDIMLYSLFLRQAQIQSVKTIKDTIAKYVLSVVGLSAMADGELSQEEKRLYEYFSLSAGKSEDHKRLFEKIKSGEFNIDSYNFEDLSPYWLLKKYLLEVSMLTAYSDKVYTDDEKSFVRTLGKKMNIDEEEIEMSEVAVQSFVLNYSDKVFYFKDKGVIQLMSGRIGKSMSKVINRNKSRLANEVRQSKELIHLLNESRTRDLTKDEKAKVREQIVDILKCLPLFVIVALPGTFLTLPILIKILPDSVFPSSFQQERLLN